MKNLKRKDINWPVFPREYSGALGLDRIRLVGVGSRAAVLSNDKILFSMDEHEVQDLVDVLQKYLAVSK